MKKVFVYCHGYGSSKNTDKVQRMRDAGLEVIACDIDYRPDVGLRQLINFVDDYLITNIAADIELVFVGTSLGGWYAAVVSKLYGAKCVCINPAYDPKNQLSKLGVDTSNLFYPTATFHMKDTVFVAKDDELLDFSKVKFDFATVIRTPGGGHRYNGAEFDSVISFLKRV